MMSPTNQKKACSLPLPGYDDPRPRRQQPPRAAKKRNIKDTKLNAFERQYFPFHRLPCEVIAEIFVRCLPDLKDIFKSVKSKNAAPLLLCNVSSSWRSLALSIPRLWSQLSIIIKEPKIDIDLVVAITEHWLTRSGVLPLSLRLRVFPSNKKGCATTKTLLNVFIRHASRWEFVDIRSWCSSCKFSFAEFGPTPLLRNFSFSAPWVNWVPWPFTACPLLSSLSWPFLCSTTLNPDIPWHQLTHIRVTARHIPTHHVLDILRTCQVLVSFIVDIDNDNLGFDQVRSKPVEHRCLQDFQIYVYQTYTKLLQSLTLPSLTDFSFDIDFDSLGFVSRRSVHTQLLHLFTRSKCKLAKLKLGNCGFDDASTLECLKHDSCSSLIELAIENTFNRPMFTDRVILALTTNDNVLLPNLSRLSLEMCLSASPGEFGSMIVTRYLQRDKKDRLRSLKLIVRDLNDMDGGFLQTAAAAGLSVDISIEPYTDSESTEVAGVTEDFDDTTDG